jgi:hypothetical protein
MQESPLTRTRKGAKALRLVYAASVTEGCRAKRPRPEIGAVGIDRAVAAGAAQHRRPTAGVALRASVASASLIVVARNRLSDGAAVCSGGAGPLSRHARAADADLVRLAARFLAALGGVALALLFLVFAPPLGVRDHFRRESPENCGQGAGAKDAQDGAAGATSADYLGKGIESSVVHDIDRSFFRGLY